MDILHYENSDEYPEFIKLYRNTNLNDVITLVGKQHQISLVTFDEEGNGIEHHVRFCCICSKNTLQDKLHQINFEYSCDDHIPEVNQLIENRNKKYEAQLAKNQRVVNEQKALVKYYEHLYFTLQEKLVPFWAVTGADPWDHAEKMIIEMGKTKQDAIDWYTQNK